MPVKTKVAVAVLVHDDTEFLAAALKSFAPIPNRHVFVSRVSWGEVAGDWPSAQAIAEADGCEVHVGSWASEKDHRAEAYVYLKQEGFTHALIPDGDEVIEPQLLATLLKIAEADLADRVYCEWDTYWKDPYHVIRPREAFTPCILINLASAQHVQLRHFEGGRSLLLNGTYGIIHHLSYAGSDERIGRKISSWSHRHEVVDGWWDRVWRGWDRDKRLGHLHPTHPQAYLFAEHIELPVPLAEAGFEPEALSELPIPSNWPAVTIIIPLHGGTDDIRACLTSLSPCFSLLHDVLVVDNGSEDDAAEVARDLLKLLPGGRLISVGENRGFAHACNRGAAEAGGEVLLFLNSDTIVARAGLIRLIESLMSSGTVGAAGPHTNNAGHHQPTHTTYTSERTINLFASDFASGPGADRDVDMLVGFCLAVRKSAWLEVGPFDEGFGLGLFEDNDLCYRLRRKGYRLVLSGRSFIHHAGSKTLTRVSPNPVQLLSINQARFVQKWNMDLELGFATGLSELSSEPIVFAAANQPEKQFEAITAAAKDADISLCMIVKNEERVLAQCLRSAQPFFREIIVVDTGSSDSTVEIAMSFGATVLEFPWTESFSEARNVSTKHAAGKWIFWMDADDTLPFQTGRTLLDAAIRAPDVVAGFVVPVRFVDGGEHGGVQVDHVKMFRNLPNVNFEGRIHEQILRSLREATSPDAQIVRLDAVVMHSGYDTSEDGQRRKRERDAKLLELDLAERPDHPFVLFNLGMTAHYTEDHEGAIRWLRRCLEMSPANESHVKKAYAMLGTSLLKLDNADEAMKVWAQGLTLNPGDPELHFQIAKLSAERGERESAREHYLAVLEADVSGQYNSVDRGILGYKTMHNLATVEAERGDYASARQWYLKAMECAPEFRPTAFALFDLARMNGDLNTAKAVISFIEQAEGRSESWAKMREALLS